ncbi:MAG: hypothetical protein H6603_11705 [Flavobacteriales bacterium]|nr:hypothetical protein [Flavobacteriales bacterium]
MKAILSTLIFILTALVVSNAQINDSTSKPEGNHVCAEHGGSGESGDGARKVVELMPASFNGLDLSTNSLVCSGSTATVTYIDKDDSSKKLTVKVETQMRKDSEVMRLHAKSEEELKDLDIKPIRVSGYLASIRSSNPEAGVLWEQVQLVLGGLYLTVESFGLEQGTAASFYDQLNFRQLSSVAGR